MSSTSIQSNKHLVAVLLVIKTSSEPRVVFHYPPVPGEDDSRFRALFEDQGVETTSSTSEDEGESSTDELPQLDVLKHHAHEGHSPDGAEARSASPQKPGRDVQDEENEQWNALFGLPSRTLAKLLCPPVAFHKKKLDIRIGGKTILGLPAYTGQDGTWKRKRKRRLKEDMLLDQQSGDASLDPNASEPNNNIDSRINAAVPTAGDVADLADAPDDHEGNQNGIIKAERKQKKALAMFNLCLVLNPPPLQHQDCAKEMFDHVIKKFAKALRWEQARSNYVAIESSIISSAIKSFVHKKKLSTNLTALYSEILAQSSLARSVASVYNHVSTARIASLKLTPSMSLSIQIPIPPSMPSLPSATEIQQPGLWLTTATAFPSESSLPEYSSQLSSYFGLLLLCDLQVVLGDISTAASPLAGPLMRYLRETKPTKSFKQISQSSGMSLNDIQVLASHLIYWRRGRAVPPLNQRDTYVVSPNADLRNLMSASSVFARSFPLMPSLPKILGALSGTPRTFSTFIPSKDYKAQYMEVLAWLMRGGWVTQLRTFGWIRVPPQVTQQSHDNGGIARPGIDDQIASTQSSDHSRNTGHDKALPAAIILSTSSSAPTSVRTTSTESRSNEPAEQRQSTALSSKVPTFMAPHQHSAYLSAISKYVSDMKGQKSAADWDKCVKYFDGKHALEMIPIMEGWKRKRAAEIFNEWEDMGILTRSRHW